MKTIIGALFTKRRGFSRKELTSIAGITDSGELSKQLKALINGDFIIEYDSFGNPPAVACKNYYTGVDTGTALTALNTRKFS